MQNGRKIGFVVLDWSGTVSDDRRCVWSANMAMLAQVGKPQISFEEWLPTTRLTAAEFLWDHGVEGTKEELTNWYQKELAKAKGAGIVPLPYPDALETVHDLVAYGIIVAVLSSHPEDHLREETAKFGFDGLIAEIVGNSHNKVDGLNKLVVTLGVRERRYVLFVGDTVYDIRAAKDAGVLSAGVCYGYHTRNRLAAENPDFLFGRIGELKRVIATLPT